ncbi:MAG: hypothetical protein JO336_04520 [Acidobacteriia bacterium]|nr:hypothetical protein [Terriglobia bacterium]
MGQDFSDCETRNGDYFPASNFSSAASRGLELFDLLMLFLQFVEQHGIEHLIFYGLDLAIGGVGHEIRIDLGHFFGNETVIG